MTVMTSKCQHCGAGITLVKAGVDSYKWVTDTKKPNDTWKCGRDPAFPVKVHSPKENK